MALLKIDFQIACGLSGNAIFIALGDLQIMTTPFSMQTAFTNPFNTRKNSPRAFSHDQLVFNGNLCFGGLVRDALQQQFCHQASHVAAINT